MHYYIIALKRLLIPLLLIMACVQLQAQQLKTAEYFYDTDPGFGKGTQVTLPKNKAIDSTFTFNVAAITNGLHTIYVRTQDTAGKWSLGYSASFIKTTGGTAGGSTIAYVNKVEYFFDKDPGLGSGTQLTAAANKTTIDSTFTFNVSSLSNGLHTVYVRAQDNSDNWSLAYSASFIKTTGGTVGGTITYVSKVEYFFDKDPGVGLGTQVPVAANKTTVDSTFTFNIASLTNGLHTLYVRAQDANENWNLTYNTSFIKQVGNDSVLNITRMEYYLDVDPGFGNATALPLTAAANINDTANFTIPDNGANTRTLYVRALDSRGNWSLVYDTTIDLCQLYKAKANFGWVRYANTFSFIDSTTNNPLHKTKWLFDTLAVDSVQNPVYTFPQGNYSVTEIVGTPGTCRADTITLPLYSGLEKYYPDSGLNGGDVIFMFYGGGLDTNAKVTLVNGSNSYAPYIQQASNLQQLASVFDLHTAAAGVYDVHMHLSNGYDTVITKGFTLGNAPVDSLGNVLPPEIDIEINAPQRAYPGSWAPGSFTITNSGGVVAKTIPWWYTVDSRLQGFSLGNITTVTQPAVPEWVTDSVNPTYSSDSIFGNTNYTASVYGKMIASLNAGETFTVPFTMHGPKIEGAQTTLYAWANNGLYGSPLKLFWGDCFDAQFNFWFGFIPVAGCLNSVWDLAYNTTDDLVNNTTKSGGAIVTDFFWSVATTAASCGGLKQLNAVYKFIQEAEAIEGAAKASEVIASLADLGKSSIAGCNQASQSQNNKSSSTSATTSWDPNEITGPQGYDTTKHFINGRGKMGYMIGFENKPTATASAQRVYVTDTLDKTKYDLKTFELTSFTIGDTTVRIPVQRTEYTTTLDLRPANNLLLRLNSKLDTVSGIFTNSFLALDPTTKNVISDTDTRGFLPPDVDYKSGMGNITFAIKPLASTKTGDVLSTQASIVFDSNAAILTNVWINTLDKTPPTAKISDGRKINDSTIELQISSSEVGSGINRYDIYYAQNAGAYIYAGSVSADSLKFTGRLDSTYRFYCVPFDNVYNTQTKTATAEYTVTFTPNALPLLLTNFSGQYVKGVNVLTATITDAINVNRVELQRSADGVQFSYLGTMATGPTIGGTYTYNDQTPFVGDNYYRLRVVDNDGGVSFSKIVLLDNSNQTQVSIYPNPFVGDMALQFVNAKAGKYFVTVSDMAGRKLTTMQITLNQGNQTVALPASNYARGTYFAVVTDASGNILLNQKVVKER